MFKCMKTLYFDIFFFFSSRRRHTRFDCDWSSDVCSSDLRWELKLLRGFQFETFAKQPADNNEKDSGRKPARSEEHTSELQSQSNLVCRLLLEKKKKKKQASEHILQVYHHTVKKTSSTRDS